MKPLARKDAMIGQWVRQYRIEAKLGAGGMGEVYRARDTRLDRAVAIKVLAGPSLANRDRKTRFMHEAKAASALSHPNIVTIHDIDTAEQDGQSIEFIAMEYVQGKTLDQLIGKKGLKLDEVLRYGAQIADALAAAHAVGIVHRDLKPANIMVTEQGQVKLLDFGLAKLTEPLQTDAYSQTESIRIDPGQLTEQGTIVGTVAYMSPEQAEGKKVDARSDIFSFGTVLYEMTTGRRAFTGDSKLSTLASILHTDPTFAGGAASEMPRELERIILRCVRKEPERRWQSIADVRVALEDLRAEFESGELAKEAIPARVRPSRWRWIWPLVALAALAGGWFAGRKLMQPAPPIFHRLTYRLGDVNGGRFAADGQTIVYSAAWAGEPTKVYTTRVGSREFRPLDLPPARLLSVSSTGELAVLLGAASAQANDPSGTLARVPLAGGAAREVLENVLDADWSPDGSTLAVERRSDRGVRIEYPMGKVIYENPSTAPISLRVSPKGDAVAFFDRDPDVTDYTVTVVTAKGEKRALSRGWWGTGYLAWAPGGKEIWFSATRTGSDPALRAVNMEGRERVVSQTPEWMLTEDLDAGGRLLTLAASSRIAISYKGEMAAEERDLSWLDTSRLWELSADGKQMLFTETSYGQGRNTAIYLRRTDGSQPVRLGDGVHPSLSPDGRWVLCVKVDGKRNDLVLLPTGAGEQRTLSTAGMLYEGGDWFPDGKRILFWGKRAGEQARSFVESVDGGAPVAVTAEGVRAVRVSPDGKDAVFVKDGKFWLQPLDGGGAAKAVQGATAAPGDAVLRWSEDGRALFVRRQKGSDSAEVLRVEVATGRTSVLHTLRPADPAGVAMGPVAVTADGRGYAYSFQRDTNSLYLVEGLR